MAGKREHAGQRSVRRKRPPDIPDFRRQVEIEEVLIGGVFVRFWKYRRRWWWGVKGKHHVRLTGKAPGK